MRQINNMKVLISLILLTLIINTGCTQTSTYIKFINSFPLVNSNITLRFGVVVGTGPKMTNREALAYVYDNDSTKLYCKQKIFNMETEKVEGVSTELYLPQKCLRIKTKKIIIILHSIPFNAFADTIQVTINSMCAIQAFQAIVSLRSPR